MVCLRADDRVTTRARVKTVIAPRAPSMSKSTAEIYIGLCTVTNKVYVGSAVNALVRIRSHKRELNKGIHNNSYLQRAWNKYGEDGFIWRVVDTCQLDDRWTVEQQWIDRLFACDPECGFNVMHSVVKLQPSPIMSGILTDYWAKRWSDKEYSKRRTEELQEIVNRPEVKAKMSSSKKANWSDSVYKERQLEAQRKAARTDERRAVCKARTKELWQNPEWRAKQTAERAKRFKDPEFRKKLSIAAKNRKRKRPAHNEIV